MGGVGVEYFQGHIKEDGGRMGWVNKKTINKGVVEVPETEIDEAEMRDFSTH